MLTVVSNQVPEKGNNMIQKVSGNMVKRWPADLTVPSSLPSGGGDPFHRKQDPTAHSLSLLFFNHHDMTEILLPLS